MRYPMLCTFVNCVVYTVYNFLFFIFLFIYFFIFFFARRVSYTFALSLKMNAVVSFRWLLSNTFI